MAQPKIRLKIIDALMALASEQPWDDVSLEALAARAGIPLPALRAAYDGRLDILADFTRRIDETVLEGLDPDMAGEAKRERLFDVLFGRFEALAPHKQAIRNIAEAARRDPLLALALNRIVTGSMAWMLTGAGIPATGGAGALRAQGLAMVWTRVMRTWLRDDDPGQARTMAELDRQLRQAERSAMRIDRVGRFLQSFRRGRASRSPSPAEPGDAAEAHPS